MPNRPVLLHVKIGKLGYYECIYDYSDRIS